MDTRLTTMGPNSWSLAYTYGASLDNIAADADVAVTSSGWTLHDSITSTSKVYKAPMADAAAVFKYVRLHFTTTALSLMVYESWDVSTHSGTNLAFQSNTGAFGQQIDLVSGGVLFLFVSPRWLLAFSRVFESTGQFVYGSVNGSSWSGCLEIQKENTGEVTGTYPRFAWTNGYLFAGRTQASVIGDVTAYNYFSLPRTRSGSINAAAAALCSVSMIGAAFVNRASYTATPAYCNGSEGTVKSGTSADESLGLFSSIPTNSSPFSPNHLALSITPYAYENNAYGVRGAFYGIKMLPTGLASAMDTLNLKVDGNLRSSVFGTSVKHAVLTNNSNERIAIPL